MQSLDDLIEQFRSILIAEKHLKTLNKDLEQQKDVLQPLIAELDAIADVLDKEPVSNLRRLFTITLINEEQQHEIEKQEYLLTALKYKQCKEAIELIEYEKNILTEKVKKKIEVESQLNMAIDTQNMEITNKYPKVQRRLFEINEALKDIINYKREIYEARLVSIKVQESLNTMLEAIIKAQQYEHWGEFYKDIRKDRYYKIKCIDNAHIESSRTVQLMKKLKHELEDIIEFEPMTKMYAFKELMHFQDYFSESLITDWIVKNNINVSEHKVSNTLKYIERIMISLDKYRAKAELKYQQLNDSKVYEIRNAAPSK